jgi:hypothetical protein
MDMDILLAVILITTVTVTLCGSILIGTRMWLRAKTERMSLGGRGDIERLTAAVESLHEQTQFLQEEIGELHERVDFAERLLTKGDQAEPYKPDPLVAT